MSNPSSDDSQEAAVYSESSSELSSSGDKKPGRLKKPDPPAKRQKTAIHRSVVKRKQSEPGAIHGGRDAHSFFCALCGTGGSLVCCDSCVKVYHEVCVARLPKLPATCVPSVAEDEPWSCPKCLLYPALEATPHHASWRSHTFNVTRYLQQTPVPLREVPLFDANNEVSGHVDLVSHTKRVLADIRLVHTEGYTRRYCLAIRSQEACLRGTSFLGQLCLRIGGRVDDLDDVDNFIHFASEITWLSCNIIAFADATVVRDSCEHMAAKVLDTWFAAFQREYKSMTQAAVDKVASDPQVVLGVVEAYLSEAALHGPFTERAKTTHRFLQQCTERFDLLDVLEMRDTEVVMPESACPNCRSSFPKKKSLSQCPVCGFPFPHAELRGLDYSKATDMLVWSDVFHKAAIPFPLDVGSVLTNITGVRPYGSCLELGREDYILQGYLVTHIIFVVSGWGEFRLSSAELQEEHSFLRHALSEAVRLEEVDLVGEVMQALRLFGAPDLDTQEGCWVQQALDLGRCYLLSKEIKSTGRWTSQTASFWSAFHATYCAVLGLCQAKRSSEIRPMDERHLELVSILQKTTPTLKTSTYRNYAPAPPGLLLGVVPVTVPRWSEKVRLKHDPDGPRQAKAKHQVSVRVVAVSNERCVLLTDVAKVFGTDSRRIMQALRHLIPLIKTTVGTGWPPTVLGPFLSQHSAVVTAYSEETAQRQQVSVLKSHMPPAGELWMIDQASLRMLTAQLAANPPGELAFCASSVSRSLMSCMFVGAAKKPVPKPRPKPKATPSRLTAFPDYEDELWSYLQDVYKDGCMLFERDRRSKKPDDLAQKLSHRAIDRQRQTLESSDLAPVESLNRLRSRGEALFRSS
ncbi:MAG: uncharacterized protein KVP18_002848 [Porospora cf. gigantea A]|uniref:uncharacterized protein n=1 Tax=Porospora cf. gigantea A TaxID=2853593 RepID=UPI00355A016F|nr:MAG: hypothetical protein KVP18_002848 [Porospora cf. gigantea A]